MRTMALSRVKYLNISQFKNILTDGDPITITVGRNNPEKVAVLMTYDQYLIDQALIKYLKGQPKEEVMP